MTKIKKIFNWFMVKNKMNHIRLDYSVDHGKPKNN